MRIELLAGLLRHRRAVVVGAGRLEHTSTLTFAQTVTAYDHPGLVFICDQASRYRAAPGCPPTKPGVAPFSCLVLLRHRPVAAAVAGSGPKASLEINIVVVFGFDGGRSGNPCERTLSYRRRVKGHPVVAGGRARFPDLGSNWVPRLPLRQCECLSRLRRHWPTCRAISRRPGFSTRRP
jgi:hypothetical protein